MPDASRPATPSHPPRNWAEAFSALPQEAPAAGAWTAVAARMDTHRPGRMLPGWLVLAAAAAVVFAVTVSWHQRNLPVATPATRVAGAGSPSAILPAAASAATEAVVLPPDAGQPANDAASVAASPMPATRSAPASARASHTRPTAIRDRSGPAMARLPAAPEPDLTRLYQESAQLESLLALARDERAGSAGAMLLGDAFDARIADIDALLASPGLAPGQRELLWEARVDALRQAAGFVSTQRLLAVQGHGDSWLVSVD
jgi:hypothetical protein